MPLSCDCIVLKSTNAIADGGMVPIASLTDRQNMLVLLLTFKVVAHAAGHLRA